MRYYGTVIRPPSEANSYILQITYGCSHNKCTFCPTYLDKPFKVRPAKQVFEDIHAANYALPETRRVFLADGNAMVLPTRQLLPILEALNTGFPELQRISTYANALDILGKTADELKALFDKKLTLIYTGLESGSTKVLKRVNKGATAQEIIEAVLKAQSIGFKVSVIGLLGLGGRDLGQEHARETGKAVSIMSPRFFSLLTLMIVPGTVLYEQKHKGQFALPRPLELLREMRMIIEHIDVKSGCIFRTNHASNYLALQGRLDRDKHNLLKTIDAALEQGETGLRPEYLRGL
jgi:radical SAM superfamily enzyme YgiQ (UPF0313 family)